jgi:superfamily II DNA/RNA helicase
VDAGVQIPKQLSQLTVEVPCSLRLVALVALLRNRLMRSAAPTPSKKGSKGIGEALEKQAPAAHKVVVFFSTTASVDYHFAMLAALQSHGHAVVPGALFHLHGSLPQVERTKNFSDFRAASAGILLTTDVAARGLDFPQVDIYFAYVF